MSSPIPGRVLVVDDELQLMDVLVEALIAQGYEAQGVQTGLAAIEALQQQKFDILLTDLMMPGMDGIALLRACMAIDQYLVGIIMTGQGTVSTAVEAMKTGAFDYVLKPFRLDALLPILARAKEVRQLRLENIQLRESVAIYNLSQTITLSLDSKLVLEKTADTALQQMDADEVSIMLLKPENNELFISIVRGKNREHLVGQRVSTQDGIAGWVARQSEPLILHGEISDPRFAPIQPRPAIHSAISMPMLTGGKLVGVLNINSLQPYHAFTAGQVKALSILTSTAAAALENEALYHALERRERRFRALTENAPDGITVVDESGKVTYVSPSVERILGYSQTEALGQPAIKFVHPEDSSQLLQQMSLLTDKQNQSLVEYRFRHKDGSWKWLESTISNLVQEPGIEGIVFNYRDITDRKRAEAAIIESERQMAALVTSLDDIVFEFDIQGTYINVWAADESLLYRPKHELLGQRILDVMGEENGRLFTATIQRVTASGHSEDVEYSLDVMGGKRWFVAKISPIRGVDGSQQNASMLIRDITQRKEGEEALAESERKYRTLTENLKELVYRADPVTFASNFVNSAVQDIYGYTVEEWLGGSEMWEKTVHPDDRKRVFAYFSEAQRQFKDSTIEYRIIRKDGAQRWVMDHFSWEKSSDGTVVALNGILADITDRKQAEDKVTLQLQRLNALHTIDKAISTSFDMNLSLSILLNQVITQLDVNAAAILLYDPNTLMLDYAIGKGFTSSGIEQTHLRIGEGLVGKVALEKSRTQVVNLMEVGDIYVRGELLKEETFVSYYATPLIAKGELMGVLEVFNRAELHPNQEWLDFVETLAGQAAIAIDNSNLFINLQRINAELEQRVVQRTAELHQLNSELQHANRAKDEFLATMSHELRTPLNSILGLSESLLEETRGPINERQQEYLKLIESSGQHLLQLINDVLDLSKIEAGKFDYFPQVVGVEALCRSSMAFVREQAVRKSIQLVYEEDQAVSEIQADPRRTKQMLVNLLTNAVKFTLEGGQVTLQVHANEERELVQFSVIDTGIGIAPEDLRKLFRPFVQLDSNLNRQYEGTGLGLVLVQKMADLHGGSVEVESEVGKGSRFTINLPWRIEPETLPQIPAIGAQPAVTTQAEEQRVPVESAVDRRVVLLAEDNSANILTISEYLESHGYEVMVAHDGWETIAKAEEINPNIILMDIQMPAMDGLEATRRLREDPRLASTPIIALTALAMPGDRERCLDAGATEYMSKPVSLKKLVQTVQTLLTQEK